MERFFDPVAGLLASRVEGWETRPQQLRMAEAVARCFQAGGASAVEAATGTGKTFAYLVPALLHQGRVVIATGTRNLQDQVFHKDLPLLRGIEGLDGKAVLVKGLTNYLCLRRFERFARGPQAPSPAIDPYWNRILAWAPETKTGDVAEIEGVPESHPLLREVTSGPGLRLGQHCPWFNDCHVTRLRRAAEGARIIVTNHHLFFADLALREFSDGVLPDYDAVVFDEAHRLEDVATEFFGHAVSLADLTAALQDGMNALRGDRGQSGGSVQARRQGSANGAGREPILRGASRKAEEFFSALGERLAPRLLDRKERRWQMEPDQPLVRAAVDEDPYIDDKLQPLYHELDDLLERAGGALADLAAEQDETAAHCARRLIGLRETLATVVDHELPNHVFWAELPPSDASRIRIGASPIDLAPLFTERVFERIQSVVLTSATLAPGGSMDLLARTIGYPADDAESLVLDTPFDVESNSILYVPDTVPDPGDPAAPEAVSGEIARLVNLTGGGALILFSSWKMMKKCFSICSETLQDHDLIMQGQAPRSQLARKLREAGDAVLFATASFREGVDIPGQALRLVIVDKVPFSPPDEPVVEARMKRIEEAGQDPFLRYQLPSAVLSLKQGLGRLLRTRKDHGILAVLDPRIWKRAYGKRLLASLPRSPVTRDFDDVVRFWRARSGSDGTGAGR